MYAPSNPSFSDTGNLMVTPQKQIKASSSFKKAISNLSGGGESKNRKKSSFYYLESFKQEKHSLNPPDSFIQLQSMQKVSSRAESVSSVSSRFSKKIDSFKLSPDPQKNKDQTLPNVRKYGYISNKFSKNLIDYTEKPNIVKARISDKFISSLEDSRKGTPSHRKISNQPSSSSQESSSKNIENSQQTFSGKAFEFLMFHSN